MSLVGVFACKNKTHQRRRSSYSKFPCSHLVCCHQLYTISNRTLHYSNWTKIDNHGIYNTELHVANIDRGSGIGLVVNELSGKCLWNMKQQRVVCIQTACNNQKVFTYLGQQSIFLLLFLHNTILLLRFS